MTSYLLQASHFLTVKWDQRCQHQKAGIFDLISSQKIHAHTHPFNGPFSGTTRWAGTRKVKPIWILLKQETASGSSISWAIYKSAFHCRQITTPAPHHSLFYRPDAFPAAQRQNTKGIRIQLNLCNIPYIFHPENRNKYCVRLVK